MRRYRRAAQDFLPRGDRWHVCCIQCEAGEVRSFIPSFALAPTMGGSAYRRPPVWRAVVRPARYFFIGRNCLRQFRRAHCRARWVRQQKAWFLPAKSGLLGARAFAVSLRYAAPGPSIVAVSARSLSPRPFQTLVLHCRVSAARRLTIGTKVSKSTGLGTWRSKPASMAAATSPFEA
jgi:hypothetical protein